MGNVNIYLSNKEENVIKVIKQGLRCNLSVDTSINFITQLLEK